MNDDEIINRAWNRPPTTRDMLDRAGMSGYAMRQPTGIGDVHESKIVGDLVGLFAQLGEPSCALAVKRAAEAIKKVDDDAVSGQ